ncbi:23S rRNA (pseudouridine(1915)-N(3))-methyltransferase RlmH [uncultured Jannaschia sp.]|uniref:23S rRNA (pseudouridine(1915)-N(3))-methyltransferase RlmH n=1 Tax=uncultured Jannaschia sp. TaxID=293347 RepID=UPI0026360BA1|nr:23S rRNA (pseudouridine(1915)-N(3))-methyltransferase RlmH [uncultured Jannaschia sp.]
MRIDLIAVGRLRKGPEKTMIDDYLDRFAKTGRGLGLPPLSVVELDAKGGGQAAEVALIERALPEGAVVVALDERGRQMTSPDLATLVGRTRDDARDLAFVIGGADGLTPALRDRADVTLSFGSMVWPHMLARVMLTEQLYRAASILTGSPYHRA